MSSAARDGASRAAGDEGILPRLVYETSAATRGAPSVSKITTKLGGFLCARCMAGALDFMIRRRADSHGAGLSIWSL